MKRTLLSLFTLTALTACQPNETDVQTTASPQQAQAPTVLIDGFDTSLTGEQITSTCEQLLTELKTDFTNLTSGTEPATLTTVVRPYDNLIGKLSNQGYLWYVKAVHPDAAVRNASTECTEKLSDFNSELELSNQLYLRLAAVDLSEADPTVQFMMHKVLQNYRTSGVDKDEQTRDKIRELRAKITEIGNTFDKNIRDDVRYVKTKVDNLAGLPEDYIAAKEVDEDGNVTISTDYPDLFPVFSYGENDALRKELLLTMRSRGYPVNEPVLKQLIETRHALATLLGYENFAALSMSDKMIGTPDKADSFLTSIGTALKQPVEKEKALYLARWQKIHPEATEVQAWQAGYISNLLKQEDYALDAKEVRQYFEYDKVRDGIFKLTEDLFGVTIQPWQTDTWHEDVETYEILENGELIGRFYMDNHPRDNKYKHAAMWDLRPGIKGQQIPLSALAQNFPKGLMEHNQVETFLHEFGHLLHSVFAGTQEWYSIAGMSMERDFVEAPSQMLEEWVWDYDTLIQFATNEAGEPIPKALVDKMVAARDLGSAIGTASQIYYANLSLQFYNRDPDSFALEPLALDIEREFSPYSPLEGTHMYTSFGHLNGYSSNYYTYQWSLAIATDMFSQFKQAGIRDTQVAKQYRDKVLGAAGSKPAAEMVEDFLGRPFTEQAYIDKLKAL